MSLLPAHPAADPRAQGKVCANERCATLLDGDAELCDECGGTLMRPLQGIAALLCGWDAERPVVFSVPTDRPSIVGRSASSGPTPDVDLSRFRGSQVVHRRHASLEQSNGTWQVTHLGTNALVVTGRDEVIVDPGATVNLHSGDTLQVGDVLLQFVVRPSAGRI